MAAAPQVDWSTVGQGAPGQITTTGPQVDWSSVGQAPTSTTPTPNVPAPKPSGGGGLFGNTFHAITGALNPANMGRGLGQFVKDAGRAVTDVGEKAINTGGAELGNALGTNLDPNIGGDAFARSTNWGNGAQAAQELKDLPAMSGLVAATQSAGKDAIGNAQLIADAPSMLLNAPNALHQATGIGAYNPQLGGAAQALANPIGKGDKQRFVHEMLTNPAGTVLNDYGIAAMAAGYGGEAAGALGAEGTAASLADASQGLGRIATPLSPLAGYALHGIDLPGSTTLDENGNVVENARHIPGISDLPVANHVSAALQSAAEHSRAGKMLSALRSSAGNRIFNADREMQATLKGVPGSNDEHAAAMMIEARLQPPITSLVDRPVGEDPAVTQGKNMALNRVFDDIAATGRDRPTLEAARLVANPNENVNAAYNAIHDVAAQREAMNLQGVGAEPGHGPLHPAQTSPEPLDRSQYRPDLQAELDKLEADKNAKVGAANKASETAARLSEAAQKEEAVARGNTGQVAEEAAAAKNTRAQTALGGLNDKSAAALQALHDLAIERANPEANVNVQMGHVQDEVRQQAENMDTARRALAAMGMDPISRENMIRQVMPPLPKINDIRAEASARAKAAMPNEESIAKTEASASSNAAVHVRNALETDAEATDAGLRNTSEDKGLGSNDLGPARPGYDSLTTQEKALYRQQAGEDYANRTSNELRAARDRVANTLIGRGKAAGQVEGFRSGKAAVAEFQAKVAVRRASSAITRLDAALDAAKDDPRAAAAQYRTPMTVTRDAMQVIHDAATSEGVTPEVAAALNQIQSEMDKYSHLEYWQQHPEAPGGHVIQPSNADINRAARGKTPGVRSGGRYSTNKSARVRQGTQMYLTKDAAAQLEHSHMMTLAHNEYITALDKQDGKGVADALGHSVAGMKPGDIRAELEASGRRAWNPTAKMAGSLEPDASTINDATRTLPIAVHDELSRQYKAEEPASGAVHVGLHYLSRGFRKANDLLYHSVLAISPSFLLKRTMGNALVNATDEVPIKDMPDLLKRAISLARGKGDEATALARRGDVSSPAQFHRFANDSDGTLGRFQSAIQKAPRLMDELAMNVNMLSHLDHGMGYDETVGHALNTFSMYTSLGGAERDAISRVIPIYPWAKAVTLAMAREARNDPRVLTWSMMLANMAAQNPQAFNQSYLTQQFDPLSIFSGQPGAFVSPLLRGPAALAGFNLSSWRPESTPSGKYQTALTGNNAGQDLYEMANQLPIGKLVMQSPWMPGSIHHLGTPRDQNVARYDTGDLRYYKQTPDQSFTPGVKTPLGTVGPYYRSFFGVPENAKVPPAAANAIAKKTKTAQKAAQTRSRAIKALNKRGVY